MKIVVQNFKSGKLSVAEAPAPRVRPGTVLVRTATSLISAGTDRAVIALAKKGYLGKAMDRPDLARKVINKARTDGLWPTYKVVKNLISEPIPLGYSLVGQAIAVGAGVQDIAVGDRVACAGLGHANHAEIVAVPRNLCVAVPETVTDEQASYVTLGAIAMHGLRQADQQFGATVLVVGLGLVGLLTVQMARAAGHRIIGLDIDAKKLELARSLGTDLATTPNDPNLGAQVRSMTRGIGVDAVLLTVGSRDSGAVFEEVAALARDRAKVVVVGDVKMDISRRTYFEKELVILQSRSYGPGRYDKGYEEAGNDYPVGYVRWTEGRNLQAFLDLVAAGRFDPAQLTTHRYGIEQAAEAYQLVTGERKEFTVGVVLGYGDGEPATDVAKPAIAKLGLGASGGTIGLGIIGTGQFAKGVLIPAIVETGGFKVQGVASARGLSADAVAGRYKAAYATSDARRVLDDPAIAAVVIATRHDSHGRYVIEALQRGKHVFVEKPLCVDSADLPLIEAAARASKATLTVGFNRRHAPLMLKLIAHFAGRAEPMALVYRVNAGRIPLKSELGWVHETGAGGGRIIGEACHFVDTLQAVTGSDPAWVTAHAVNPRRNDLAGDDIVTMTIGFDDGSLGTVHYFSNGDASYPKERLEVFAQERMAVLDNYRRLDLVAKNATKTVRSLSLDKGFNGEAQAFLAACRTGTPAIPLESLLATTATTIAAVQAIAGSGDVSDRHEHEAAE
ncbi:MAG: bi-domain-containing oxidoreductase [Hyphomicrobiaceae bacterium]